MHDTVIPVSYTHLDVYKRQDQKSLLISILSQDPRPSYQEDSQRIYGMEYAGMEIHFTVTEGILTVKDIILK